MAEKNDIGRAATGWLNLGVAGAAAVGAAALQSWPVAVLGGVTYVALVAWDFARGPKVRVEPQKAEFSDLKKYKDAQTQGSVRAVLAVLGYNYWHEAWINNWRSNTVWRERLWIPYSAMPIGLALLALQYVAELICLVTGRSPPFGIENDRPVNPEIVP